MELLFAIGLLTIVGSLVAQMLQSGSRSVSYSVWYKDKLSQSQRFFTELEKNLKEAADNVVIDYNELDNLDRVKISSSPFNYNAGNEKADIESSLDDSIISSSVVMCDNKVLPEDAEPIPAFSFIINKPTIASGPNKSAGFKIKAECYFKGTDLYYTKKLVSGKMDPDNPSIRLFSPKVVLKNIKYCHISHKNIISKLTNKITGSIVYLYIWFENSDIRKGSKKGMSIKQSFKLNVRATPFKMAKPKEEEESDN